MYVDKGSNVVAGWTKAIAISPDGSNWETIKNDSVKKVMRVFIPNVKDSSANNGYPFQNLTEVIIEFQDGTDVRFDAQRVSNQGGWNTGTQAALNQAVSDITTWLSV